MRHVLLAAAMAATVSAPAAAAQQAATPAEPVRVSVDVVVTPERGESERLRVPGATAVLDGRDIPSLPAAHTSEVLAALPGFTLIRPQAHAGRPIVSARGFFGGGEAEYVRLLIDGVPVGDVESGLIDWARIAVSSIARVEAARGPGAALYGDGAMGGVIQIFTQQDTSAGRGSLLAGSFGTVIADASVARRHARGGYVVSGAGRRSDGAYDHSGGRQLTFDGAADVTTAAWRWRWQAGADGRQYDDPGAVPLATFDDAPLASDPLYRFDRTERHGLSAAMTVGHASSAWTPQGRLYVATRDEEGTRTILLAPGLGDRHARELDALAIGGSIEATHAVGASRPLLVRFGSDVAHERLEIGYRTIDDAGAIGGGAGETAGVRLRGGAFLGSSWDATPRVRVSGTLRWDAVADEDFARDAASHRAWSPRLGVVMQLREGEHGAAAFAQLSRAFKAPTLDQLFDPRPYPDFAGGTFTISNALLVPQRARNVEAGMSGIGAVRWTVLGYRMDVEDEIDFDARTFTYGNIGRSTHTGLEIDVEGRGWRAVRPTASYALARVHADGDTRQLKNVPRHYATVGAWADLPWAIGLHARVSRPAGGYLDDDNTLPIRSAATIDLRLRRAWRRLAIVADVFNLTDRRYAEYGFTLADFTGRTVGYVHPGAPRAWRLGVTTAF